MTPRARLPRFAPAVLLLAAIVRVAMLFQAQAAADTFAPIIDSEAYLVQGLRVASGDGLSDGVSFQAPLYPLLLGAAFRAAGLAVPHAVE